MGIMSDTLETAVTWENLMKVWAAAHEYVRSRPKAFLMIHISHVYENGANLYFTFLSPMIKGNEQHDFQCHPEGWSIPFLRTEVPYLIITVWAGCWLLDGKGTWKKYELMAAVKRHLDPNNIMNPGGMLGLL